MVGLRASLVMFVATTALLVVGLRTLLADVVPCHAMLAVEIEPHGWRAWPLVSDQGGYRVVSERGGCVGHGLQCAMADARLEGHGVCPGEGVSLAWWFDRRNVNGTEQDIQLRSDGGEVFVVTGVRVLRGLRGVAKGEAPGAGPYRTAQRAPAGSPLAALAAARLRDAALLALGVMAVLALSYLVRACLADIASI